MANVVIPRVPEPAKVAAPFTMVVDWMVIANRYAQEVIGRMSARMVNAMAPAHAPFCRALMAARAHLPPNARLVRVGAASVAPMLVQPYVAK